MYDNSWNYNHIDRYPNKAAALQSLAAREQVNIHEELWLNALNAWEDAVETVGEDDAPGELWDTSHKEQELMHSWEATAKAFGELLYKVDFQLQEIRTPAQIEWDTFEAETLATREGDRP